MQETLTTTVFSKQRAGLAWNGAPCGSVPLRSEITIEKTLCCTEIAVEGACAPVRHGLVTSVLLSASARMLDRPVVFRSVLGFVRSLSSPL